MTDRGHLFSVSNSADIQCEEYGICTAAGGKQIFDEFVSQFCLAYLREGRLCAALGASTQTFEAGDVLLIQPSSAFVLKEASRDFCFLYVFFDGNLPKKHFRSPERVRRVREEALAARIGAFMDRERPDGFSFELKTIGLISDVLSFFVPASVRGGETSVRSDFVDEFIAYVNKNYMFAFDIRDVCREIGISVNYFTNCFSKRMRISPKQFVIEVRIARAKEMLCSTSLPVSEVSRYTGYEEPLHFSREFRKRVGMSPADYRKQQKNLLKEFKGN